MRLAFCFMSNKPANIYDLEKNFIYTCENSCIDSFSVNLLTNPPVSSLFVHSVWNTKWTSYKSSEGTIDYFHLRQRSLMRDLNVDLLYVGDDDCKFKEGSTEVINQCCQYMKDNPDCGGVWLGGKFGGEGALHGDEIFIANKGSLATNRGIILRNRPILMDNRFHALGSCEDAVIGFTCLMQGYYIARRLNVSSIDNGSQEILTDDNKNINYNLKFIREKGIRAKISQIIGLWDSRTEWPKEIWSWYHKTCVTSGIHPIYDSKGDII
jgi:hypothetical protein